MLTILLVLSLAGCGDSSAERASTQPAATTSKPQDTTPSPQTDAAAAPVDATTQSYADLAWSRNEVDLLQYCVHKLGAREGLQQPPSAAMRRKKNLAVLNLRLWARDSPTLKLSGKPLETVIIKAESELTNGKCDDVAAKRLRGTLDALDASEPIEITDAEKAGAGS